MFFVYFLFFGVCESRVEEFLIELNEQYYPVLGKATQTLFYTQTLISGYLPSDLTYTVCVLNNTLESSLELYYFEFSHDFITNLAQSHPQFVSSFESLSTKDQFEKAQNQTFERFGVVSMRKQEIRIEDKAGKIFHVELAENLVYTEEGIFKFVVVLNGTEEVYYTWKSGEVELKDQHFPYRVFICPFLLGIVVCITFLYCFYSSRKKFPCIKHSEFSYPN